MVDVDRDSQTLTLQAVEQSLTPQTRAIVAVHLAGWPCEMDRIMGLAESRGLRVIEDCAQAQGARYKGRPVGSLGHVAAFSFCQDKIMTTGGEGGMITTNDLATWERAWSYRDHGRRNEPDEDKEKGLAYRWVYDTVGTNWRMTEMQSAIGRSLLTDVLSGVDRRRQIAGKLHEAFAGIPALRLTVPPPGIEHAYYRYYAFVRPERLSNAWSRDRILAAIRAEGIPCFSGCCPEIYEEKGFERYRPKHPQPIARELGQTSVAFPVHPTIQDCDVQDMIDAVEKVITHASS
jgi:dTDP-4-amino-4,6-dideoxygalactose transaminase